MGTIGGQEHPLEMGFVGLPEVVQLGGGMCRSVVHHHDPEDRRLPLDQALQMGLDFLMPFPLMEGIQAFPGGVDQASQQGTPGIFLPRRIHLKLLSLGHIGIAYLGTPMQIGGVEEDQTGGVGRHAQVRVGRIVTGQGAVQGFFFNVSIRSRLTVYNGSGEVTFSLPRFHRIPKRFNSNDSVG